MRSLTGKIARLLGPDWPWIAAVLLCTLIAAWPAVSQPGLLNTRGGGDSPFLLQRLHQLVAALDGGHFPARWMPDANYGYGYPFYNYYAPLSIYVAAAFRFVGFSFIRAIHLAQIAGFVVAGLGMFHLGRRWLGSRWGGLLAAVAYTVAPFHMVNVYVRGDSLAEFWAMAFYPWVLLVADGVIERTQRSRGAGEQGSDLTVTQPPVRHFPLARPIALFALAYAALILSHNISALIFTPFLLLYLLVRLLTAGRQRPTTLRTMEDRQQAMSGLWSVVWGLLLAFALAAWFFVPALAEQDMAQLGPVTEGYFHFGNHFRGRDLMQGELLFAYNPDGGVAFRLGLAQVGLAVAGAAVLLWHMAQGRKGAREKEPGNSPGNRPPSSAIRHPSFVVFSALIAIFMITPLSRPLWEHLPLLPFTQFPWRFLSVASFFMALAAGGLVLITDKAAARAAVALSASLVLLASGLLGLRIDHLILTDADVTAARLAQYEWFTGNIGTTVSAEYLTPDSTPRPWTSAWLNAGERDRVVATAGEVTAELIERQSARQTWRLSAGDDGAEVVFPTMQWPGWRATLDGQPAELRAHPSSGQMTLSLPSGEHTVTLELGRTPVRLAAELLSLAAVIVALVLFIIGGRAVSQSPNTPITNLPSPTFLRGLSSVVCGLVLVFSLAFFWRNDPTDLPPGDLTWDFAQMAYLHHDISGVGFDNDARLHQYGYSAAEIAAGETLTVTLSVDPGDGRAATLALVAPAAARPVPDGAAEPPAIIAATQPLVGESVVFTLPIPADAPPGLFVPRLTIDDARPLMPSGARRGDLFLRPVRVSEEAREQENGDERQSPTFQSPNLAISSLQSTGTFDVRALALTLRDATTLDGRFAWYTARPLGARFQFSWRLQDPTGGTLAQLDAQPGYGYQPSTGWASGQWTTDWLALALPDAAPATGEYPLVMRLYDANTGATLLARRVGVLVWDGDAWQPQMHEPSYLLPSDLHPLANTFGGAADPLIALRGYRVERDAASLRLTLYWEALADLPADYTRFVHLLDADGEIAAQIDGAPAGDSYPTGQWVAGEIVADTVVFDLSGLPPGEYRPAMGFYRPDEGLPRLEANGPDGPLPDGRAILPEGVLVGGEGE